MFAIAKKHPGILIKFGINYDKYCAVIEERAEKENIDIDHKPLFTYMWNDAMREEIATVDMTHWQKKKEDYLNELLDAEHSSTVQDEIKKSV
ncbi:MAG: hypothetical protein K5765_07040 [Clostridia bacterium]|nr:hypothetical protein [Clostridia bacterium]